MNAHVAVSIASFGLFSTALIVASFILGYWVGHDAETQVPKSFDNSELSLATSDEQLRGMIRRARVNGSKFVIPRSMYDELIIEAKGGNELAGEALEVVCVVQRIPTSRNPA